MPPRDSRGGQDRTSPARRGLTLLRGERVAWRRPASTRRAPADDAEATEGSAFDTSLFRRRSLFGPARRGRDE